MSRDKAEPPRQNSQQFAANNQVATTQGGSGNANAVKACILWTLRVKVTGLVNQRRAKLDDASIEIDWSDGTRDARACHALADDKAEMNPLVGKGPYTGECRAQAKGWYLEAAKTVSLADGDDKTVDLVLKPAVWIGFKVVEHKSGELIEQLQVKAKLAAIGDVGAATLKDAPLEIEHDDLRPGQTCKLLELSHDSLVWEVVGDVASA